jgi:hypothetical protein
MKERELRENSICKLCEKKIGHCLTPLFYRVRIQVYGLDLVACSRQQGLGLQIGAKLAQVLGPDEELASKVSETEVTICHECAMKKDLTIALLPTT